MAGDNLIQLGKTFKRTQDDIQFVTRRVSENFPMIERVRDEVAADFAFRQEFYIYHDRGHSVHMSLYFFEEFEYKTIVYHTEVPHTFTVGDIGIWLPLVYLGDLNFEGHNYSTIFSYSSTGTFDISFKVSFDTGEVDVTDVTTVGTSEFLVPLDYSNLVSPPDLIIDDVYVMGRLNSLSGTLLISAATNFQDTALYSPHKIETL
jgi:hypothetical protein